MQKALLLFLLFNGICLNAQDHLRPEDGFFGSLNYQVDYYSKVRKLLYAGLDDMPNARVLILPSFAPEGVFDLSFNEKRATMLFQFIQQTKVSGIMKWRKIKRRLLSKACSACR